VKIVVVAGLRMQLKDERGSTIVSMQAEVTSEVKLAFS
jgi:hypothetical protein